MEGVVGEIERFNGIGNSTVEVMREKRTLCLVEPEEEAGVGSGGPRSDKPESRFLR
jgi:hypothetical protein